MPFHDRLWSVAVVLGLMGCAGPAMPPAGSASPLQDGRAASARARFVPPYSYEWFVRAELARARGDWTVAAEAYERVLAGDTDDPYVLAQLARVQIALGTLDRAEATLALALRVDATSADAWLVGGLLAERRGQLEQAMALYQDAARVAPESELPWIELSRLLRAGGHESRASALWHQRPAPGGPAGNARALLQAEGAVDAGNPEQIAFALQQLVREHGSAPDVLRRGVSALLAAGRAELAVPLLAALPAASSDTALRLQVLLGAAEHAAVEQLLTLESPQALGGTLDVVEAYLRIGRPAHARERLAEVADVPDDWRRQRLAGWIALELAECAAAVRLLASIPPASAEHPRARKQLESAIRCAGLPALAAEAAPVGRHPG